MTDLLARPRALRLAARLSLAACLLAAAAAARAGDGVIVSGSAYVDFWGIPDRSVGRGAPQGLTLDASLKVGVDIHDDLSFTAKACASCHGFEMEHVALEYTPKTWFNVQAGRILVPFGEYSQRADPSGHKPASAPLIYDMGRMAYGARTVMNLGIVPMPYSDTGALAYGVAWLGERLQVWYGLYGVAGLKGSNDVDWMALRTSSYSDNNRELAGGARLALTYSADANAFIGDATLGGSFTGGRYDKDAKLKYLMWGVDASFRLGPFTARGEYAARRTDLDPDATGYRYGLVDDWFEKEGWYGELEHPLGRYLAAVYRFDELRRKGAPLPGASAELSIDSRIQRYTGGLVVTPAQGVFVKLSYEYWDTTDFEDFHSYHVGMGGAF
ncbi:conserved hypothetical protein [Anaeromyxobacter sp. K]|uniref:hypothetical protein n=1 Tax=Anaeromyxobacter sp. (strain K) TaxID=447217 RepID=UPI00015F8CB8|nr:hypothetical protein [Anaeromyxobacter sp. K]ACG72205.1 conserved hypothetical protein [Anaeromyxobacter sp. K]